MAKITAVLFVLLLLPFGASAAQAVTSEDMIERAKELDGRVVIYEGEIVGDIMARGDHAWINVSDGANALGIFVSATDLQGISLPGRYGTHGDQVRMTGIFHRACPEHGGDMDIHATHVQALAKGYPVAHVVQTWKAVAAMILAPPAAAILLIILKKHRGRS